MPTMEEYIEEIKPIFQSHMLTNMGPIHEKFRQQLIEYLEVPHVSLFVNGHTSLEMAIQAVGMKEKGEEVGEGEVITTPFTFVSTTHAIVRNGLKPIFCDISESDYCIDPEKIENLVTDKTVGIIPVHVYGNVCDVDAIDRIAEKYRLKVIYDGAHAFGVKYHGIGIGNYGDATMFSFHATKVFNSIEGGSVTFNDQKYEKALHDLKNFGIQNEEEVTMVGGNGKMDEFRAAMGICNLRRIDECIKARKNVFDRYHQRLGDIAGLTLLTPQPGITPNYAYYPVLIDEEMFTKSRDDVYLDLRHHGIFSRKYFYPAVNEMQCYQHYSDKGTPVAHMVSQRILTLPIYEGLTNPEIDKICSIILERKH